MYQKGRVLDSLLRCSGLSRDDGMLPGSEQGKRESAKEKAVAESSDPQRLLREFQKCNEFFVGIDSDGCAFDTMEVKHKECFIPNIIRYYNLAAVSKYAREAAEFINLYSQWRGINRFPALIMSFDLLIERPEVLRRHHPIPALTGLCRWVERETKLSNPTLKAEVEATGNADLVQALEWSEAVNRTIGEVVHHVPPFSFVRESLESMQGRAYVMVVSTTPGESLDREWQEHGLKPFVGLIPSPENSRAPVPRIVSIGQDRLGVGITPGA